MSLLAMGAATAGFGAYLMYPSQRTPAGPPNSAPPADRSEAFNQDLNYLKASLHSVDRSFTPEAWLAFDTAIAELQRRSRSLDDAQFEMGVAKAVASANNGHTNLLGAARGLTLNSIPLRFCWFADGLHVVKSDPAHSELLGAKVSAIAGQTPAALVEALRPFVGGQPSLARELSIYMMESPQALQAAGLQTSSLETVFELVAPAGLALRQTIAAGPVPAAGPPGMKTPTLLKFDPRELVWPARNLSAIPLPVQATYPQPVADGRQWVHVLGGKTSALSLQKPNLFYWSEYLPGDNVLYLQLNALMDEPGKPPLKAFLNDVLNDVSKRRPKFAIVDLRWNPGGSYLTAATFAKALPGLLPPNGRLFILTSGNTFSAGIVTAALLKHFAGARVEIVGEPVGDAPRFWAEAAARIVLPNSGLRIGYATGLHDWGNGCTIKEILTCYPLNYFFGVAAGKLEPTMPVRWSFTDYIDGKDTVIDTVMRSIPASR